MDAQPRRVNYSVGMLLTASDFEAEQEYHRQLRYLHNRLLHGYGTVAGLEVVIEGTTVHVSPGLAIDERGREIVVTQQMSLRLDPLELRRGWTRDLAIAWREIPAEPVPGVDDTAVFTRWMEEPELSLALPDCAAAGTLVLARLTWRPRRGEVDIDATVRRPLGLPSEPATPR